MKLLKIIFALLIIFSACKKKDDPTPGSTIDGNYKGTYHSSDNVHPDIIDSNAIVTISNNTITIRKSNQTVYGSYQFSYDKDAVKYLFVKQTPSSSSYYVHMGAISTTGSGKINYFYELYQDINDPSDPGSYKEIDVSGNLVKQ